ncbi:MAG: hypothetical protein HGA74_12295, partial [Deltaproteobacteria bacterium]|nr:hypothetical protein [Deltaproteobacteria bacterium]
MRMANSSRLPGRLHGCGAATRKKARLIEGQIVAAEACARPRVDQVKIEAGDHQTEIALRDEVELPAALSRHHD